jgi:hypothetical protein
MEKLNELIKEYLVNTYCILEICTQVTEDIVLIILHDVEEYNRVFTVLNNHYFKDNYILEVYEHYISDNVVVKEKLTFDRTAVNNEDGLFKGNLDIIHLN